jgi:PAS domain S-box-containing protein
MPRAKRVPGRSTPAGLKLRRENVGRIVLETMTDGALAVTTDGEILYSNARFAAMLRVPRKRLTGASLYEFTDASHGRELAALLSKCGLRRTLRGEVAFVRRRRPAVRVLVRARGFRLGQAAAVCLTITDATEREGVETELRDHRNRLQEKVEEATAELREQVAEIAAAKDLSEERARLLRALGDSSDAMLRARNERDYLDEVCRIIVKDCGHAMVWIGYAQEDEGKTVRPVAYAGFEEGYLETLRITWADTERGRGPTGTAIRTGKPGGCANMLKDPRFKPWRAEAIKRGYASSMVLPLMGDGKAFGAITIYSREPDAFSKDEVELLAELADDLAYGIAAIRMRAAHAKTEAALERTNRRLALLSEVAGLLLATDNPQEVVQELCHKVMAHLDCHVFFNYLVDPEAGSLRLNAYSGVTSDVAEGIATTPDPRTELVKSFGIKAYACHPMQAGGRLIGTLSFGTKTRSIFSDEDLSLMKAVTDQVAMAMERMQAQDALKHMNEELEKRVAERTVELAERVKELRCLYAVSDLTADDSVPLESMLWRAAELIPEAMRWPEAACARVVTDSSEFRTERFVETPWKLSRDIVVVGKNMGSVEVCYREVKWPDGGEPFVEEEVRLIDSVAEQLGETLERRRADAQLAEQARLTDAFFANNLACFVILDKDYNFIRVNKAYADACRRDISEFPGRNHFEIYPSDAKLIFDEVRETKKPSEVIARPFVFPDHPEWGATYWDWSLVPILDAKGEIEFFTFSLNDVTERVKAVEAVRAASVYARGLLEAGLDPLVTISHGGRITDVNAATEQVTGVRRERLIGSDFCDYFTEPDKARASYRKVLAEGSVRDYPLTIRHASGRTTDVLYNATVYRDEAGAVLGVFAAARDVTERRQAEERLADYREKLRSMASEVSLAEERQRREIATQLHDRIGQELAMTKMRLAALRAAVAGHPEFAGAVAEIYKLVEDTIRDTRSLTFEITSPILYELGLEAALGWLAEEAEKRHGLSVRFESDQAPKPLSDDLRVVLFQAVRELLLNVAKHARAKQVEVRMRAGRKDLRITVEDDGVGFDPADVQRRLIRGGGFGLFSIRERLEYLGGAFEMKSAPGSGTAVTLVAPLKV